ncbi:hypothetical protein KEM56_006814, partial [Ascosphaera pollenicola]
AAASAEALRSSSDLTPRKSVRVNIQTRKLSDRIQDLQSHAKASASVKPSARTIPKPIGSPATAAKAVLNETPSILKTRLTNRQSMRMLNGEDFATRRKRIQQAIAEAGNGAEPPSASINRRSVSAQTPMSDFYRRTISREIKSTDADKLPDHDVGGSLATVTTQIYEGKDDDKSHKPPTEGQCSPDNRATSIISTTTDNAGGAFEHMQPEVKEASEPEKVVLPNDHNDQDIEVPDDQHQAEKLPHDFPDIRHDQVNIHINTGLQGDEQILPSTPEEEEMDPPQSETSQPQTQEGVAKEQGETIGSSSSPDSAGGTTVSREEPKSAGVVSTSNLPEIIKNNGLGDVTALSLPSFTEQKSTQEQTTDTDSTVPPKVSTDDQTTNDGNEASRATMNGEPKSDPEAHPAQASPSVCDTPISPPNQLPASESDKPDQALETHLPQSHLSPDVGSTESTSKPAASDTSVDHRLSGTVARSVTSNGRYSANLTDRGSLSSYATASGRSYGDDDDSFVTPRESLSSSQAHSFHIEQENSLISVIKGDYNVDISAHEEDEKATLSPETRPPSPSKAINVVHPEDNGPHDDKKDGITSDEIPSSPKISSPSEHGQTSEIDSKPGPGRQSEALIPEPTIVIASQETREEDSAKDEEQMNAGPELKINQSTMEDTFKIPEASDISITQTVIKEDEEDDMNNLRADASPKQPNESLGGPYRSEDLDKEQLLKKRRSQIFQQTMSRRSEEHERELLPTNAMDAITAAQRQLHRPSKRWTVVSRESSVVGDALSLLSHSKKTSISSRKGDDQSIIGASSLKSRNISSRRHSKQSSEDSIPITCLSEHDDRRSTDINDLDGGGFDERDAANVVLPYTNESSMHVLQQHYPDVCLTDTNKAQQEKASKRMTQLFLSELSKGGFDTTLLTRPELNSGRHSGSRFRLSQHRRKDSDISWTSLEHDNLSVATQESFGDHNGEHAHLSAEPRPSVQKAPPDTPRTPHSFKNAHPEHEELGISIGLGSPTSFTIPPSRERDSRVGSLRSISSRPRSESVDLHSSPKFSPPTPPPPASPTPQRSCSPSIMSSMVGLSSRRDSLLSVSSSNKAYVDNNQMNQDHKSHMSSRIAEDPDSTRHSSRMFSVKEQGLTPIDSVSSVRFSGTTLREKRISTRDADYKRLKQRRNIIKELIDTEHRFTQDMTIIVEFYMQTAPSCSGMTPENAKTLFGNADKVFQFTTAFQDELKHAARSVYSLPHSQRYQSKRAGSRPSSSMDMNNGNGHVELSDEGDRKTSIGFTFMANAQRMEEVYAEYLKNHDSANKMLDMLQKREVVRLWLTECKGLAVGLTDAWDLDSLLVKPVQRMLKYPLLLTELLSVTPQNHPDFVNLQNALNETTSISVRINESKKRADVVGQVINSSSRRRRESDVRAGLTKAFTWRGDKLKHHAERYNDHEFDLLANQFGENFFHTQLIIRDVDEYIIQVQKQMQKFYAYVSSIDAFVESHETQNQILERKWHKFAKTVKHFMDRALIDHISAVRKSVSQPMFQLLKLHEGPQRVMQKRNKRYMDYTRFRYIQDRHERPDRKTTDQAEQFDALNITLKEELPRLFKLSAKLMGELLGVFGHLQAIWNLEMQSRFSWVLGTATDYMPGEDLRRISSHWAVRFNPSEKAVGGLSICNGTLLADNATGLGLDPAHIAHSRRPSAMSNVCFPTAGQSRDLSSRSRSSSNLFSEVDLSMALGNGSSVSRVHTPNTTYSPALSSSDSKLRGPESGPGTPFGTETPQLPPIAPLPPLPSSAGSISTLPALSLKVPSSSDLPMRTARVEAPPFPNALSSNLFPSPTPMRAPSPQPDARPHHRQMSSASKPIMSPVDNRVLFCVKSLCQFNIEPNHTENGYSYLSYGKDEYFGVVGEKGDLWLAWNQADPTRSIGWIWTKHFDKVPPGVFGTSR